MLVRTLNRDENNFDAIRLLAAFLVLVGHARVVSGKPFSWDPENSFFSVDVARFGVLVFFVVSGFLVAHSWSVKKSVVSFFAGRVLRIFPALAVVILGSTFILGPLLTSLPLREYFSSAETFLYLKNISLYRMYYELPGVFEHNIAGPSVNASVWTLPYEFTCYLFLILLGLIGALKNRWVCLGLFLFLFIIHFTHRAELNPIIVPALGFDFLRGYAFILYFFSGVIYYQFRNEIPINLMSGLAVAVLLWLTRNFLYTEILLIPLLPWLVLSVAFSPSLPFSQAGKLGDFSYAIYLLAFPIQQIMVHFKGEQVSTLELVLYSTLIATPLGWLSWKYIEKPALGLKKYF